MAEDQVIYEQIETGDPDPLGLRKQLKAAKQPKQDISGDPLGLRAKLTVAKMKPDKSEPATEFKPMTDWVALPGSYQPMVFGNVVQQDDHSVKTAQSKSRVQEHLMDMNQSVETLIRNHKKELTGRIKSQELGIQPKEVGPVNYQAQQLEQQLREEIPVDIKEVEEFKLGMNENPVMLRQGLNQKVKDLSKFDPVKANILKTDIYRLDRQDAPDKESEVTKNIEKIKEGEYDYDVVNGRLVKPEGFFGSLVTSYKQKNQAFSDYDVFKSGNEEDMLKLINKRLKEDPDSAIPVPDGASGYAGAAIGGQPLKPLVGAGVAGLLSGGTAAAAAGAAISAPEMYRLTFGSMLPQNYAALKRKNPTLSDSEVLQQAVNLTNDQANTDALSGAAMGALGAKAGFASTGLKKGLLQKSIGSALAQVGEAGVKKAIEGLGVGSVGAVGQAVKNALAEKAGLPDQGTEGVAEQLWGGIGMTMGMTLVAKFPALLKPKTYNQLLQAMKGVPEEAIGEHLNQLQEVGEITPEQAQQAQTALKEQQVLDASIKPDVPEADRLKAQELIKKRNELEASLEIEDKAYHTDTKEKIKSLNDQINNVSKGAERGELQKLVDAENKDGKIVGVISKTLADASEGDLKSYMKDIAEQASDPATAQATKETFGENIVNKALELYPTESPKESKVSVIRPGEIRQPETITIKPKTDAIPEQIANEMDVREQTGDGEAMGAGDIQPESAPREEIPAPIQEGDVAGQEGVGGPPATHVGGAGIHAERPKTQLSFRGLQDTANEFGFEDVKSRDPKSDLQTRVNAESTATEWAERGEYQRNIDDLLDKIDKKQMVPTDEQRLILEQYIANEKQKARDIPKSSPDYNRQLQKVQRIKEIGEIARSEAGAALRIPDEGSRAHPITDEVDAMVAKMETNKVDQLTDQQKAEVEAQVEKYKQRDADAQAKISKLEEQVANIDAQKEFNKVKSTTKRVKKTAEERVTFRRNEIEAAREALRKLRTGESGMSVVPLPGIRELVAIAPHVKNIMVDLVAQGVDNLQDVVKHLHAEFKDVLEGITEKDIHDVIAGEYNEKAKPLSELQRQIRDIQDEAKLINQLEALLNGKEPKAEGAKRERNRKIKELRDKITSLKSEKTLEEELQRLIERREKEPNETTKRELSEKEIELKEQIKQEREDIRKEQSESGKFYKEDIDDDAKKLMAIKKRNQKREQEIKAKIAAGQFEKETKTSIFDREDIKKNYPKLRKEALDAIAKKEEAQHEFDLALFNDEMSRRGAIKKGADFAAKLVHTSKAVLSGIDDSGTFVQNGMAMLANPKIGAKVWLEHWKDAFNDARFKRELAALHERPDWEVIKKSKLEIVEPHSAASKQVEEAFEKNLLAGKVKVGGKDFQPWKHTGGIFERAFTSMGNNMRIALFEKQMASLREAGKTFESHPEEYKAAARAINELTGRGKLPAGIAQASPYISPFIWAPRMLTSTINVLGLSDLALSPWGKGYYQNLTPVQRKFALGQLGRGIAVGVGVMGAAALGGATVDYDPRSVTFGDVIMGDHHYNVFGRYTPVVKAIVQFATGTRLKKDGLQDLDSGKRGAKTRIGVVGGFFRGKMTPFAGSLYDLAEGKNYFTNQPFGVKDVPEALVTPMSVKELIEGWKNDGTWTILNRFLPAFEGLKVSDERDFEKAETAKSSGGRGRKTHKRKTNPHKKH